MAQARRASPNARRSTSFVENELSENATRLCRGRFSLKTNLRALQRSIAPKATEAAETGDASTCSSSGGHALVRIMGLFCPTSQRIFRIIRNYVSGQRDGYCAWGCFRLSVSGPRVPGLAHAKRAAPKAALLSWLRRPAYSAACFCGGSSAPDLWISATW